MIFDDITDLNSRAADLPYATISDVIDMIDDLESQLAACAAGPWRTDVENAPKGVPLLCWQWTPTGCAYNLIVLTRLKDGQWTCGNPDCCEHDPPIAFAELNPYQEPTP
jgi:hypothetical protein